jgi:hypothetical protein
MSGDGGLLTAGFPAFHDIFAQFQRKYRCYSKDD